MDLLKAVFQKDTEGFLEVPIVSIADDGEVERFVLYSMGIGEDNNPEFAITRPWLFDIELLASYPGMTLEDRCLWRLNGKVPIQLMRTLKRTTIPSWAGGVTLKHVEGDHYCVSVNQYGIRTFEPKDIGYQQDFDVWKSACLTS